MVDVALLFAAGTNCDLEMAQAFELAGARVTYLHINEAKADPTRLRRFGILGVPGGFTYGDYIAAGRIFANELRFRLRDEITRFIEDGKLILGVCNGFQVLVKAGILPGTDGYFAEQSVTLEFNDSHRFEDRWVYLKPADDRCVFTAGINRTIYLPVAHAEGKFVTRDMSVLKKLRESGLTTLRYSIPPDGRIDDGVRQARNSELEMRDDHVPYPWNPNGSTYDIAGICDPTGRVFGLMPHPERFVRWTQHPRWTRKIQDEDQELPDGLVIYRNAVNYAKRNL